MSRMQQCSNWVVALVCLLAGGLLLSMSIVSQEPTGADTQDRAGAAALVDIGASLRGAEPRQDGLLHQATIRDWHEATEQERLAAAAALLAAASGPQYTDELQERAAVLARCISEATGDKIMDNARIADVGAACLQMLGY